MNEEPARPRKLLVHAKELERINGHLTRKGLTLIPTKMYFNKKGWVKVEIAVGQGKKLYDKRDDIKKREIKREIDRSIKSQKIIPPSTSPSGCKRLRFAQNLIFEL